jgi:hypothetical protein
LAKISVPKKGADAADARWECQSGFERGRKSALAANDESGWIFESLNIRDIIEISWVQT